MKNKRFRNIKTGDIYVVKTFDAINATNANDGQKMVIYYKEGKPRELYPRERTEFFEKFEPIRKPITTLWTILLNNCKAWER